MTERKREARFLIDDHWTRWFSADEDLSFLKNNASIMAVEIRETMTREEAEKYLRDHSGSTGAK